MATKDIKKILEQIIDGEDGFLFVAKVENAKKENASAECASINNGLDKSVVISIILSMIDNFGLSLNDLLKEGEGDAYNKAKEDLIKAFDGVGLHLKHLPPSELEEEIFEFPDDEPNAKKKKDKKDPPKWIKID